MKSDYTNYTGSGFKKRIKPQFPRTEYILTTKADTATKKVNEFIAMLEEKDWELVEIKPLICFSGPSLQVGAMVLYFNEEEIHESGKSEK